MLDIQVAIRAQWIPYTNSSELPQHQPHPGGCFLVTVTSLFRKVSLISTEEPLLPQTLAHKFQQSNRKCLNSFEKDPDFHSHEKKKASAQDLNEMRCSLVIFCCSTCQKRNKTASLPHTWGISSDVASRPEVDITTAVMCTAVGHHSITTCQPCLGVCWELPWQFLYVFCWKQNSNAVFRRTTHELLSFAEAFTGATKHLLIKLSPGRKL